MTGEQVSQSDVHEEAFVMPIEVLQQLVAPLAQIAVETTIVDEEVSKSVLGFYKSYLGSYNPDAGDYLDF